MARTEMRWLSIAAWLMIAGCSSQQSKPSTPPATGDASWREENPPGTSHYTMEVGGTVSGGKPIDRATPVYPVDQLATCPAAQEVTALLIVDKTGEVSEVRVADETQSVASRREFVAAVRKAALQWKFSPLKMDHWDAAPDGKGLLDVSETKPFSLTYAFHFECHAGNAAVTNGTLIAPHS
jgi:hypothetical protein